MDFQTEESVGTTNGHEDLDNGVDQLKNVHQDSLPVNLTMNGVSSDESDNVDSGEEDNGSFEDEDHVKHASNSIDYDSSQPSLRAEDEEIGMCPHAPTNDDDSVNVEKLEDEEEEEGRESDYEEPRRHAYDEHAEYHHDEVESEEHVEEELAHEEEVQASHHHHHEEEEEEEEEEKECGELINLTAAEIEKEEEEESKAAAVPHTNREEADGTREIESGKPNSSGDNVEQKGLGEDEEEDAEADEKNESRFVQQSTPPRNDDVLPPTGLAKRMVEQWSNIDAQRQTSPKPPSSNNVSFSSSSSPIQQQHQNHHQQQQSQSQSFASDAPQYAPNTAKTIAAKFSAGITGDQETPKPKPPAEPNEQWPSQGQARGLIAKFSAMRA